MSGRREKIAPNRIRQKGKKIQPVNLFMRVMRNTVLTLGTLTLLAPRAFVQAAGGGEIEAPGASASGDSAKVAAGGGPVGAPGGAPNGPPGRGGNRDVGWQ
jgi:hypothetical protein